MTLSGATLMFRENLMKVNKHLIKHTPFINFAEIGKDNNETIIFYINFAFPFISMGIIPREKLKWATFY